MERWELQEVARSVLQGVKSRVKFCFRYSRPKRKKGKQTQNILEAVGVSVWAGLGAAFYSGLVVCGSIWVCPVCASRISEGRRKELKRAIENHRRRGGRVYLLTLTFPHYRGEDLQELYGKLKVAREKLRNRKTWKGWARSIGLLGSVCSKEVTYGENGWHVHTHEILFVNPGEEKTNVSAADILPAWRSACKTARLPEPSEKHGVNIQSGEAAAAYVSKWGLEEEVTKWHSKKGRQGGKTPFDFLRDVRDTGDCESADLFREYARVFKGKRQLVWSDGLRRELLGEEEERTDEELAADPGGEGELLGVLKWEEWKVVLAAGARGQLLEIAQVEGWPGVLRYVEELRREKREAKPG